MAPSKGHHSSCKCFVVFNLVLAKVLRCARNELTLKNICVKRNWHHRTRPSSAVNLGKALNDFGNPFLNALVLVPIVIRVKRNANGVRALLVVVEIPANRERFHMFSLLQLRKHQPAFSSAGR